MVAKMAVKMVANFPDHNVEQAELILASLRAGRIEQGIERLGRLKDDFYASIPDKKRQSQGITWVVRRISDLLVGACGEDGQARNVAQAFYMHLPPSDRLMGVPIFMMAAHGQRRLEDVIPFFEEVGNSVDWVVREFAAAGVHKLIKPNREAVLPWLKRTARCELPNLRRMVSEALRPVTDNRWMQKEPQYSLGVLRLMFQEAHPYPRTSVGNNLSDLSRQNTELIFSLVQELVEMGNADSYWIAYRACRNLVKGDPRRVMDVLDVDEYHYKDRNFYRGE